MVFSHRDGLLTVHRWLLSALAGADASSSFFARDILRAAAQLL